MPKYSCIDCPATFIREDSAYVHTKDNHHCTVDAEGNEAYCNRWDH